MYYVYDIYKPTFYTPRPNISLRPWYVSGLPWFNVNAWTNWER